MIDTARQTFLAPQLHADELAKINLFLSRRLSNAERMHNWRAALELTHRKQTVLELLVKRNGGQA